MKKTVSILFALFLALGLCLVMALPAYAVHTLTPGASVDIDADTNGGAYTALNNISFTDAPELVATNTFFLTAPAGFEFNATAAADQAIGTGYAGGVIIDLGAGAGVAQPPVYTVGNTVATWTVTAAGTVGVGTITISGMELRPTAAKTTIVGDGTANVTIAGNVTTFDSPNAHPIDHVPGALNNFLVEAQGGGAIGAQTAGVAFLIQITARDQHNNTLNDGTNNFDGAGNTVDITSNVTIGAGGGTTIAFTAGVLNNHSMTLTQTSAAATITATDSAGGLGTGTETGTSNAFVVNPGPIDHYAVTAIGTPQVAGVAFAVTIQAQDVYNNNITAGGDAAENITISFGLADAGATPTTTTTAAGTATENMTMTVAQAGQSITFTGDTSAKVGTSNVFTVTGGAIDHYAVSAVAPFVSATVPFTVIIQAQDAFNNNITVGGDAAENITITLGKADAGATPTSTTTAAGVAAVSMTMTVPQTFGQSITFTGVTSGKTGTSNTFDVATAPVGGAAPSPSGSGSVNISYFLDSQGRATVVITLTSTNGLVTMNIPSGTLVLDAHGNPLANIQIVVLSTPPPPPGYVLVGHAYDCRPDGATFKPAMILTFKYYEASLPPSASEQDLVLAYWDGGQWVNLPTTIDAAANTATAEVTHFTPFALIAPAPPAEAPPGETPQEAPPAEASPAAGPLNVWMVVGIIAAIIVAVLLAVMLGRGRSRRRARGA